MQTSQRILPQSSLKSLVFYRRQLRFELRDRFIVAVIEWFVVCVCVYLSVNASPLMCPMQMCRTDTLAHHQYICAHLAKRHLYV